MDCLGSVIAQRIADREEVPSPSRLKRGQRLAPVPFWIAGKLDRETVVRRMLDPDHDTGRLAPSDGDKPGRCLPRDEAFDPADARLG